MKTQGEILQDLLRASQCIQSYTYSLPLWFDYEYTDRCFEIKKILDKINEGKVKN